MQHLHDKTRLKGKIYANGTIALCDKLRDTPLKNIFCDMYKYCVTTIAFMVRGKVVRGLCTLSLQDRTDSPLPDFCFSLSTLPHLASSTNRQLSLD